MFGSKKILIEIQQQKIKALEGLVAAQNELIATQNLIIDEKNKIINEKNKIIDIIRNKNSTNTSKSN